MYKPGGCQNTSGTTTNEAFHRELNYIFDDVHTMDRATMELKLKVVHIYKLMAVVRAMDSQMLRKCWERMAMHRALPGLEVWSPEQWEAWCAELGVDGGMVGKAAIPKTKERQERTRRIRVWSAAKRAAAKPLDKRQLMRRPAAAIAKLVVSKQFPKAALLKRPAGAFENLSPKVGRVRKATRFTQHLDSRRALKHSVSRVASSVSSASL